LTKIYLIRHAEAEGNIYRRAHGHHNGLITHKGYNQIEKLKKRFIKEHIDAVYSSDLVRACITSTALTEPRGLMLNKTEKLREVGVGVWEDMAWGDIVQADTQMHVYFSTDPDKWKVDGSERFGSVIERMVSFLTDVGEKHSGQTIAAFSHGYSIRAFLSAIMGVGSEAISKVKHCDNTGVTLFHYSDGVFKIEYQMDTSHLSQEESTLAHQTWWRDKKSRLSENMRFEKLDKEKDAAVQESYRQNVGQLPEADLEFATFLQRDAVGMLGIDTNKEQGLIKYLYLLPNWQGRGFGVQLIGHAVSFFRKQKKPVLRVELPMGNPAIKLFLGHGFNIISESHSLCLMEKNIQNW